MSGHTPRSLPLHGGSNPGGQEGLGKAGQGQGPCWVLPLTCGSSEQSRPRGTVGFMLSLLS